MNVPYKSALAARPGHRTFHRSRPEAQEILGPDIASTQ